MPDLGCWGGCIVEEDSDGYMPQGVMLKCVCGARGFHTKNIGYIGARTIYDFKGGCDWMQKQITASNCHCDGKLSVDEELMQHVKDCEECRQYGF